MNIDKFGHHIHKRSRLSELFNATENFLIKNKNDEYHLHFSRLRGVREPKDADEVINLEYFNHRMAAFYCKQDIDNLMDNTRKKIMTEIDGLITNLKTEVFSNSSQLKRRPHASTFLDKIDFIPE